MGRRGADRPGGEARGAAGAPFAEKQGWDGGEGSTGASKVQATPSSLKRGGVRFVILSAVQTSCTGGVLCHSPGGEARSRRLTREVPGQGQGFPRLPSRQQEGVTSPLPEQMGRRQALEFPSASPWGCPGGSPAPSQTGWESHRHAGSIPTARRQDLPPKAPRAEVPGLLVFTD